MVIIKFFLKKYNALWVIFFLFGCGYIKVNEAKNNTLDDLIIKYKDYGIEQIDINQYNAGFENWYLSFNNKEFSHLLKISLGNSFDIKSNLLKAKAAQSNLGISRSAIMPEIGLQLSQTNTHSTNTNNSSEYINKNSKSINFGVQATYEVDLWGKNYSKYKEAIAKLKSTYLGVDFSRISIVTTFMKTWVQLMSVREQRVLLTKQKKTYSQILSLNDSSYKLGTGGFNDLIVVRKDLLNINSQIKELDYNEKQVLYSINILLGRDPLSPLTIKSNALPKLDKLKNKDINLKALSNRPDIKAKFYQIIASKYNLKVAKLSRLPSIDLNISAQTMSDSFSGLFDTWLLQNVGKVVMPIFNGGALYGAQQASKFMMENSVILYKKAVFQAVENFKERIDNENKYKALIKIAKKQAKLDNILHNQIISAYLEGEASYSAVLQSSLKMYSINLKLLNLTKEMAVNRVAIYESVAIPIDIKRLN